MDQALQAGLARIDGEGEASRIYYTAVGRSERYVDPEEQVRAEFWAELIYRYGYPPERVGVEITVPDRTPRDAADIVIFADDRRVRPYAVIEVKREGISDSEFSQAVEQAAGNGTWSKMRADYVGVVAGLTRRFLDFSDAHGALERERNIVADLPLSYGKPIEFKYHKGTGLDIGPVSREELIVTIRKCHQSLWGGGRLSPPAAFGELCKLIFVKISDETAKRRKGQPYQFQIRTNETSRELGDRIRALYDQQKVRDPDVFTDTLKVDDMTIRTIVSHLEPVSLSLTDLDTKGVAFEQFMDSFFKGDFGQYFTPREVIQFAVEMLTPTNDDILIDPACGSGGFLLYALDAVRREADQYYEVDSADHFKHWHDFAQKNLYGIEINDEIARVAKMNMIIHDDGHTNVVGTDALLPLESLHRQNRGLTAGRFDLVLTNPPFGATVSVTDHPHLASFELARDGKGQPRRSQKSEILFIERVHQLLVPGTGRAAIVLPDGVLANASLGYVRDFVLERFQVLAVVSLPPTAFTHYGAAVKSSVVFLRRRGANETASDDELTFMAAPSNIGYDATGRKTDSDLPSVLAAYRAFRGGRA